MGGNQVVNHKPGGRYKFSGQRSGHAFASRISSRLQARRSGQELVEFAVVLPFLLVVVVGVLDLGRAFHAVITITNVAREGARYGVDFDWNNRSLPDPIATGYSEIVTVAFLEAQDSRLDLTNMTVTPNCGLCEEDSQLTVTVTYDFELILSFLPDFTMIRFATMMIP